MRWFKAFAAAGLLVAVVGVSPVRAQVIYEPVRHQYGGQNPYYYGGNDPRVHESAAWPRVPGVSWGRHNGFAFASGGIHTHREVVTERPRVFTDVLPLRNAFIYGFNASDARNEAYARVPLHFRKADLLRHAVPNHGGRGFVVPAQWGHPAGVATTGSPGTIDIRPWAPAKLHHAGPRPLLVIPKDMLERELKRSPADEPPKRVASAG